MSHAQQTLDEVCRLLEAEGFQYHAQDDALAIDLTLRLPSGTFLATLFVCEQPPMLGFAVALPVAVPEPRRAAVAETIVRANYGLSFGRFDLDVRSGEVFFYNSLPLTGEPVAPAQFRALLGAALSAAHRYLRAFNRLLYGDDLSPAEVVAEVEMAEETRPAS